MPVNREGRLDLDRLARVVDERTRLVSVMLANNETGSVFSDQRDRGDRQKRRRPVHCDGVQALGKIPVDVRDLGVDYLSLSGHKFYALKGVRRALRQTRLAVGESDSRRQSGARSRAGTENVVGIASWA